MSDHPDIRQIPVLEAALADACRDVQDYAETLKALELQLGHWKARALAAESWLADQARPPDLSRARAEGFAEGVEAALREVRRANVIVGDDAVTWLSIVGDRIRGLRPLAPLYATILPAMTEAARSCGYALAVHGTMARDLDLVAIPWTEAATDARTVVRAMAEHVARRVGSDLVIGFQPSGTPRPHGREGFSIPLAFDREGRDDAGYVDVSVMPRSPDPDRKETP